MLLLFPQYCIGLGIGWLLTAFATGMMLRSGAFWLWPVLTVVLCCLLCLAVAELGAQSAHQKLLMLLYLDADPLRFIERYEPLVQKAGLSAERSLTMHAYLSNAYLAIGKEEKALELLAQAPAVSGSERVNAQALLAGNRCSIYLQMGNAAQAREQLNQLKKLETLAPKLREAKRQELFGGIPLLEARCGRLEGWVRDIRLVQERMEAAHSPLIKADLQVELAQMLIKQKHFRQAEDVLKSLPCTKSELWVVRQAAALREQIKEATA